MRDSCTRRSSGTKNIVLIRFYPQSPPLGYNENSLVLMILTGGLGFQALNPEDDINIDESIIREIKLRRSGIRSAG